MLGWHADGGGFYLVVDPSGARRWVMLYRLAGKRRETGGLGAPRAPEALDAPAKKHGPYKKAVAAA